MKKTHLLASSALAAALLATLAPMTAQASYYGHHERPITVYLTRHAEKETTTTSLGDATSTYELEYMGEDPVLSALMNGEKSKGDNRDDVCGTSKCAEELSDLGTERAELLASWFTRHGITRRLDKVVSSHKRRTFQTVDPTAVEAGLTVIQVPVGGTELEPESTGPSECPTVQEILSADPGDTVLVAGHSGTLYDIMGTGVKNCEIDGVAVTGLGLDTSNDERFPKDTRPGKEGKVRDFGDIWKVVIYPNGARFAYRVNLQPKKLFVENYAY